MKTKVLVAIIVLLGGAIVSILLSAPSGADTPEFISSDMRDSLESKGVFLSNARDDDEPFIEASAAIGVSGYAHIQVRDVKLQRLSTDNLGQPIDKLVWAISFDPTGVVFPELPESKVHQVADYMMAFVDAHTGELIFGIASEFNKK